jgi:hypothetical protein
MEVMKATDNASGEDYADVITPCFRNPHHRICDVIADSVPEGRARYMLTQGVVILSTAAKLLSGTVL